VIRHSERGFSLVELMVVLAIITIMTAAAVPSISTAISHSRLRGAASSLAGLMQSARMQAVKQNRTLTVKMISRGNIPFAFAENADDTTSDAENKSMEVQLGTARFTVTAPGGTPPQLTTAVLSYTPVIVVPATDLVSFSPRGLPCKYASPTSCVPSGFMTYINDSSQSNGWAAVGVSPGGRIKQWFWDGTRWAD
jgi:type II secretion system protein H